MGMLKMLINRSTNKALMVCAVTVIMVTLQDYTWQRAHMMHRDYGLFNDVASHTRTNAQMHTQEFVMKKLRATSRSSPSICVVGLSKIALSLSLSHTHTHTQRNVPYNMCPT
jgi:hypothetical protein